MPNLGKVFERLMYNQIYPYFNTIFSKFHCGFSKSFNVQKGGETGDVLTDLFKAFDFTDHHLLIAELNAYRFEKQTIDFIYSYLTERKQRAKVDSIYSSWEILFSCVPQGSV